MDISVLVGLAVSMSLIMTLAWSVQRMTGASGWVDTIWSLAVGLGGIAAVWLADGTPERRHLIGVLVALWSLRLGGYIAIRTRGAGEDPRYEKLIAEWGNAASWKLFQFLQIQALAAFVLVAAIYLAASVSGPFPVLVDGIAFGVGLIALLGEAVADRQMHRFRKTPQAKTSVMESGLWAYSRHPNYFFEWLFWCAIAGFALQLGWVGVIAVLAPLQMYWLLVHVSGIPPLEEHMLKTRGNAFRALQSRVNAFFPGPRRLPSTHHIKE